MKNLKIARKRAGLSQFELATKIGLSQGQYSNWETGKSVIDTNQLKRLANILNVTTDFLLENTSSQEFPVKIPVLGNVAAGIPISAIEDIEDWEEIPASMARTGDFFGLKIKGQSMEPRIMEGDTVIVRKQPDIKSGEIAIVLVNGDEATCKKVTKHASGGITLSAYNSSSFEPIFYTREEIKKLPVTILGKVVELRGKL